MSDSNSITERLRSLRSAADLAKASAVLAGAVRKVSGAEASLVFLLDMAAENLVLYGMSGGKLPAERPELRLDNLDDPTAMAMASGRETSFELHGLNPPPSIRLLATLCDRLGRVAVRPLWGLANRIIGALMLNDGPPAAARSGELDWLCGFGGLILDARIKMSRLESRGQAIIEELGRVSEQMEADDLAALSHFGLIGESPAMLAVKKLIVKAAKGTAPILLTGATGAGKGVAAEAIHKNSPRRDRPFIAVNCAAIPAALQESEFFGHTQGAFTGAGQGRPGLLREANRGTLFLDEIGEMPLELQAKLLRVLQERKARPVGGDRDYALDVLIIAATNRDLQKSIMEGRFRDDLFHRLAVFPIELSSLEQRREDIEPLAGHFLKKFSLQYKKGPLDFSREATRLIVAARYTGNVRELASLVERAVPLAAPGTRVIGPEHLKAPGSRGKLSLRHMVIEYERSIIDQMLKSCGGNAYQAAELLSIPIRTLYDKMKKMEIRQWN